MTRKVILASLLFIQLAHAKTITVAVIDTGFDFESKWESAYKHGLVKPKICKSGHYDFVNDSETMVDNHGHGTHIAGLIAKGNEKTDYCLVIMKYYDPKAFQSNNLINSMRAYRRAINIKVDVINYSGGGLQRSEKECEIMKEALDAGIEVVAAAGNERSNLDEKPYYPALCDPRIKAVASTDKDGKILESSNYESEGKHSLYKMLGKNVYSLLPNERFDYMTGTSQATARATGKLIYGMDWARKHPNTCPPEASKYTLPHEE